MPADRPRPRIIPLRDAPAGREVWGRPRLVVAAWMIVEWLVVTNPLQPSSAVRRLALRAFGARIGRRVLLRPRLRVKFPWKLTVGDDCWIGEGVWIHNQDTVEIGHDCVISQESMITTGSHAHRTDMALLTAPVVVEPGVWITSRCMVLGGVRIGASALVAPVSVVATDVAPATVVRGNPAAVVGPRFSGRG